MAKIKPIKKPPKKKREKTRPDGTKITKRNVLYAIDDLKQGKRQLDKTLNDSFVGKIKTKRKSKEKEKEPEKEKKQTPVSNPKFKSVTLFVLAATLLLLILIPGSSGWLWLHNVLRGIFGISVFSIPVVLFLSGRIIDRQNHGKEEEESLLPKTISKTILTSLAIAGLLSSFVQIMFSGDPGTHNLPMAVQQLYSTAVTSTFSSGGVISLPLSLLLFRFLGAVGAKICIVPILFLSFMAAAKWDIHDLAEHSKKLFSRIAGIFRSFWKWLFPEEYLPEEEELAGEPEAAAAAVESPAPATDKSNTITEEDVAKAIAAAAKETADAIKEAVLSPELPAEDAAAVEAFGELLSESADALTAELPAEETPEEELPIELPLAMGDPEEAFSIDVPLIEEPPAPEADTQPAPEPPAERELPMFEEILVEEPPAPELLPEPREEEIFFDLLSELPPDGESTDAFALSSDEIAELDKSFSDFAFLEEPVSEPPVLDEVPQEPEKMEYRVPPIDFLQTGVSHAMSEETEQELQEKEQKLVKMLEDFGVRLADVAEGKKIIHFRGPTVTRYEVRPAPGIKVSKITGLSDDIALALAAQSVRIEAPIPGKPAVGIEVPNTIKDMVSLREVLESEAFQNNPSKLAFAVGKDIAGNAIVGDIAKLPHVIIAGATGSGKSVCTNAIIMSILCHTTPEEVKLILIDPKIVEFRVYEGIPHLLIPVVTNPKKAAGALNWAVQEMERRYTQFAEINCRDLADYNRKAASYENLPQLPQIVIAIDELADLMMTASKEVEDSICRLAQKARAAGMHLVIATQRPTTDIITGLIKANIPSRIALSVMSQIDSRTILDTSGAEKLLGHGDMLYLPSSLPKPIRVQGCYASTKEIETVIEFIKQQAQPVFDDQILQEVEENIPISKSEKATAAAAETSANSDAALIEQAMEVVVEMGQASTSSLQRRLKLGFARAARIMDELEAMGVIGPYEGSKPRKVLMTPQQLAERKMRNLQ